MSKSIITLYSMKVNVKKNEHEFPKEERFVERRNVKEKTTRKRKKNGKGQ